MSEPLDVIVPILQRIQADLTDMRKDISAVRHDVEIVKDDMELVKGYVTYSMGISAQNRADIESIQKEVSDLRVRLERMENAH